VAEVAGLFDFLFGMEYRAAQYVPSPWRGCRSGSRSRGKKRNRLTPPLMPFCRGLALDLALAHLIDAHIAGDNTSKADSSWAAWV